MILDGKQSRTVAAAVIAVALLLCGIPAAAQDLGDDDPDLGGGRATASLRAVGYYSDNFYNRPSGNTTGYGSLISPEIGWFGRSRKAEFDAMVGGEYGVFNLPGAEDDYLDGSAKLRLALQATVRNQLRLEGSFKHGHDAFGVDRTEDATVRDDDLDRWNRTTGSLHYRYGAAGAVVNAEIGVAGVEKHYITNRGATQFLDYDSTTFDYTLFYNYSSKTSALIDFSRSNYTFDRAFGVIDTRGGELYRVRTGVRWLATGKTSGDVRVGYRMRTFDAGSPDIEGVDWEAGVDWAPVPRSTLRLETAHSEQESYRSDARIIDIRSASLAWKHNLTARTRTKVILDYAIADFDRSGREDEIVHGRLGVEHLLRSFLAIVGDIGVTNRDSSVAGREYDRVDAFVGLRLSR